MNLRRLIALALACLLLCVCAAAQISTSTITGIVEDPTKAVVARANVVAKNEATGVEYKTITTGSGTFAIPSVTPGSYTITVTAPGFKTTSSKGNVLRTGVPLDLTIALSVGATGETVEVSESAAQVETASSAVGDVIERRQIRDLPLNGRNPLNLITLQPGLVQRSSGANGSGTHINGSRDRAYNVTLDGIDINEPSVPNPQSNVFRLNTDNVQEFRITTGNGSADLGRNSGANISLASKAGENTLHGALFEYMRHPKLQANDYFNNLRGLPKVTTRLNQFGAEVTGPIVKNRTFFSGSWQMQRLRSSQSISKAFGNVPIVYTPQARAGIYRFVVGTVNGRTSNGTSLVDSSGNLLPGIATCGGAVTTNCIATYNVGTRDQAIGGPGLNPTMTAYFNSMPAPNDFTVGDGLNTAGFAWNPPSSVPEQRFQGRIDHKFSDNDFVFGRYTWAYSDTKEGDFLNARPQVYPGFPPQGEVVRRPRNGVINYRRTLSPVMVNEVAVGFSRFVFDFPQGTLDPNFPNTPPFDSSNISDPYLNQSGTARRLTTLQLIDNLSYQRGSHTFKTGINFRRIYHNDTRSLVGTIQNAPVVLLSGGSRIPFGTSADIFSATGTGYRIPTAMATADRDRLRSMINDLLGRPSSIAQAFFSDGLSGYNPDGIYIRGIRFHQYNAYFQDDWKIRRNLTLNLGVRWEYNPPGTEANGRILRPDKPIDGSQGPVTFVSRDKFWDRQNANAFAPRIGFAWAPWGGDKTAIRGGYGIAFDAISTFQMVPILGTIPGSSAQCTVSITDNSATGVSTASATANCALPATATNRFGSGFPATLAQPLVGPSAFVTPAQQAKNTAPLGAAIDPNLKNPTVHSWNMNVQHDFGKGFMLELGYVGKHGSHLHRAYNLNQEDIFHDDFINSFIRARDNLAACNNAYGTAGCGTAVGLLAQLLPAAGSANVGANLLNNSTVQSRLRTNSAGGLASILDSNNTLSGAFNQLVAVTGRPNFFRPNSQFSSIFYFDSQGSSVYHAMQAHLRKRGKNVSMSAGYTWAKSIDDLSVDPVGASSGGGLSTTSARGASDVRNFTVDRGRSDFDRRHVFTSNWLFELPFGKDQRWARNGWKNAVVGGWNIGSIFIAQSGEAFSVLSGNFTASDIKQSRADIVGALPQTGLYAVPGVVGFSNFDQATTLNGTGFAIPAPGSFSNQARNSFTGPKFWNVDMNLGKRFDITERLKFQFRAEFYNIFNHPSFDTPEGSSDGNRQVFATNASTVNSNFGRSCCVQVATQGSSAIVSTGEGPRVIQFAARLTF